MELRKIKPKKQKMNKKGDVASFLVAIASLFAIGIIIFLLSHIKAAFYVELQDYLNESADYNESEALNVVREAQSAEITSRIWDYAFLGIYIGYIIALGLTAFSTKISPAFFWLYVLIAIIGLFVGVALSNTWQGISENPELSTTIDDFPITNALLGTYYPLGITIILAIFLILLFGKPSGGFGT